MNILHIAPLTMKKSSGLTYSVPNYVNAQNEIKDVKADLLISIKAEKTNREFYYLDSFNNKRTLELFLTKYDIVIFHSTYIVNHIKIASILKKNSIPYVIVPRGGFTRNSKNIKKLKKRVGDAIFFRAFFESPDAIQFLTENEKIQSVHETGFNFILPNGISIPKVEVENKKSSEKFNIVYVGRIDSYTKGLDVLIEGVRMIKNELKKHNAVISLYGPDVRNSKKIINEYIIKYDIQEIFQLNEPAYDNQKFDILKSADAFIQTSRFEGLSMGILEALSFGLPCILTPGTNLSTEVENCGAGIEVQLDSNSISQGILRMIESISLNDVDDFSNNARNLANIYSWKSIANQSIDIYNEIIQKGRKINATL